MSKGDCEEAEGLASSGMGVEVRQPEIARHALHLSKELMLVARRRGTIQERRRRTGRIKAL